MALGVGDEAAGMTTEIANFDIRNILHPIFSCKDSCLLFLLHHKIITSDVECSCYSKMSLIKCKRDLNGFLYKCKKLSCRKTKTITNSICSRLPKISLCHQLRGIFLFVTNVHNYFGIANVEISENTYIKMRKIFVEMCKNITLREKCKLGGENVNVQIDETAFKKGKIIRNPS